MGFKIMGCQNNKKALTTILNHCTDHTDITASNTDCVCESVLQDKCEFSTQIEKTFSFESGVQF